MSRAAAARAARSDGQISTAGPPESARWPTKAPLPAAENPGLGVTTQRDHRGPSPLTGPFVTPDRE